MRELLVYQLGDIANRERGERCRCARDANTSGGVAGDEQVNLSSGSTQRLQIELFASASGRSLLAAAWYLDSCQCVEKGPLGTQWKVDEVNVVEFARFPSRLSGGNPVNSRIVRRKSSYFPNILVSSETAILAVSVNNFVDHDPRVK